jgi:hypothetical protein
VSEQRNALRERYSALGDDELQNIAVTGGLTDEARELLEQELRRRGIQDVSEYKEHLRRVDQERLEKKQETLQRKEKSIRLYRRIGYSIALLGILTGLFVRYVQKDETNGVGIIIASAVLFPIVWGIAWMRRLVWRFLLRT